jgi:DNA-binding NarL/FixJ family response regulator
LDNEADIDVVGEADTGRQAVSMAKKLRPDVVLMDIAMPLLNGLEATRQIRKALPDTRVLILSAYGDDAYIEHMIDAGVSGYLLKQTSAHNLAAAIREVHQGKLVYSKAINKRLRMAGQHPSGGMVPRGKVISPLTSRELEVLQLIAEGKANKESAVELSISIKTIEKHRQNLMDKLAIHDTAGLTRYAIANRVIESSGRLATD